MELKTTDLRVVMLTTWAKKSAKSIAIVAFALIFCIIVFAVRLKYSTALYPVLMSAGDALTSIGLAYIFWSLVLYAVSRGGLDGVFYITHNIARTFKRSKDSTYVSFYDFVQSRGKKQSSFAAFLKCGVVLFAAGMAVLLVMYLLPV